MSLAMAARPTVAGQVVEPAAKPARTNRRGPQRTTARVAILVTTYLGHPVRRTGAALEVVQDAKPAKVKHSGQLTMLVPLAMRVTTDLALAARPGPAPRALEPAAGHAKCSPA